MSAETGTVSAGIVATPSRRSRLVEKFARAPRLALLLVVLTLVVGVLAPVIAPYDPISTNLSERVAPPAFVGHGTIRHLLGTDRLGRDILSRVIFGTQTSLLTAAITVLLSLLIGVPLGMLAGYRGGWVDALVTMLADISLSFPSIVLAFAFAVTFGPSFAVVVIIIVVMAWCRFARIVRGEVIALKQRDFISIAKVAGLSTRQILVSHILPNIANSLIVLSTLTVGWAIVTEGFLSFLGAGVPPPAPSWGGMVAQGRGDLASYWWISIFPGLAIAIVVLSFNLVGDWIRDALDPRLRQI
jgi:peptide/nickel transport system permease protein